MAVELTKQQLEDAKKLPYVKGIYEDAAVNVTLMDSLDIINAPQVWALSDGLGNNLTGVGMKIAIIDTGIDYTHPDLGGCFGPGCKVVDGYDIVNDDNDPFDDYGHGTHCAGIAAGNGTLDFEQDSILFEFDTFYDEHVEVRAAVKEGETKFPILWGDGAYFTRVGDDGTELVTSDSNSIQVNNTEYDPIFVASWNSSTESESYLLGVKNIDDDEIELKNIVTGASNMLLKGQTWTLGNVQVTLDYANWTQEIANLSINTDGSFNMLFDANGNWIKLPELSELPVKSYEVFIYNATNEIVESHEFYWSSYELRYYPPYEEPIVNSIRGVAPDAVLYAYKVLDEGGSGTWSGVIAGIEYAVDPNQDGDFSDKVDIASMSLGGFGNPDDPVSQAVDNAVDAGVIFTISAGNNGPWESSIGSPGTARKAITVGASDKGDYIAGFSSRGPTSIGTVKPDVVAPGVDIYSAVPTGDCRLCDPSGYSGLSGTSMAAPHVAGAAALMKQAHPDWSPDDIKYALRNTAVDLGYDVNTQGYGRIDVLKSVQLQNKPAIAWLNTSGNMEPQAVLITGTAKADNFDHYVIEFAQKEDLNWSTSRVGLSNGGLLQVENGVIGTLDLSDLDFDKYLLRLRVYTNDGNFSEDNAVIRIIYEDEYEPDDTYTLANQIAVGTETQVHTQYPHDDQDYVKFDANVGEMYFISAKRRTSDFYPMIEVYDTDGTTLLQEIYFYEGHWSPPVDGTYYINILDFYGKYWGEEWIGTYDLSINSTILTEDIYEPDNNFADATLLEESSYQEHNFYPANDVDYLKFNATTGSYYTIITDGYEGISSDPKVELYDKDGTTLLRGADHQWYWYYVTWSPTENGTYYVKVTDDDNIVGGEYQIGLHVESGAPLDAYEPDCDYKQATLIPSDGTLQTHTSSPAYDVDYIKFDAVVGNYYEIKTSNLVNSDTFMFLYDADGTTVITYNDNDYGNDLSSKIIWSPVTDGTYYAQIREYWEFDSGGSYDISINSGTASLDLKAAYISYLGKPTVNETISIRFAIDNEGTAVSTDATASLYEYDYESEGYTLIEEKNAGTLLPQERSWVHFNWTPAEVGEHKLKAVIYDEDDIDHSNDDAYGWIIATLPGPDIYVGYIDVQGDNIVNETTKVELRIENNGDEKATGIDVDLYDLYDFKEGWADYNTAQTFSYDGIDYQIRAEKINSYTADVSVSYESTVEEFVMYREQAVYLSNGLLLVIIAYEDSYGFDYGFGDKSSTTIAELDFDEGLTLSFDWVPTVLGDHLLVANAFVENDSYLGNNGEVEWERALLGGPNLRANVYIEDVEEVIEMSEEEILSEKINGFEKYRKEGFGNGTVYVYSITTNQTTNLSVSVENNGNEIANDVSVDIYYMHDYTYGWAPYNTTMNMEYDGTNYEITPYKIDDSRARINISYDQEDYEFELFNGEFVILNNGIIFDLNYISKYYNEVVFRLGQGSYDSESVTSIGISERYETVFQWTPEKTGEHIVKVVADTPGEADYEDNYDDDHIIVGGFGIDIGIGDEIEYSYPLTVNQTNNVRIMAANIGSEDAYNITISLYDDTYGVLIGSEVINLSVDDWHEASFDWTPTNIGEHELRAVADVANETTPENNEFVQYVDVKLPGPDLDVYVYSVDDAVTGQETPVMFIIRNEGSETATNVTAEFYVNDVLMDSLSLPNIGSQVKYNEDFSWTPVQSGNHEIKVVADSTNETDYSNNEDIRTVWVTAKQPVITITSPGNSSTIPTDSVWLNVTTDDISNCSYKRQWKGLTDAQPIDFPQRDATEHSTLLEGLEQYDYIVSVGCTNIYGGASGSKVEFSVDFTVQENNPPTIDSFSPTGDVSLTIGQSQAFSISASDPESDPLTITWLLDGASVGTGNSYTFSATTEGSYTMVVNVSDGELSATHSWAISVSSAPPVNNPPTIDSYNPLNDVSLTIGQSQTFTISASDPDDDLLITKWYIDDQFVVAGTALIFPAVDEGEFALKVNVSDGEFSAEHSWTITVTPQEGNQAPQITSYSPTETELRISKDGTVDFSVTATDDSGAPTINWYLNDADVGTGNSYSFTATGAGDYTIKAIASDGELTDEQTWTVHAYSRPKADTFDGSTTDFAAMSDAEIANAQNVVLEKTAYGKIEFNQALDLSNTIDLDSCVVISNNIAGIDNSCVPELNKPATITLYHLSYNHLPQIYYNNGFTSDPSAATTPCSFCTVTSRTPAPTADGTVTFTVSHFTVFTVGGGNNAPNANAGPDQRVAPGNAVTLSGSASSDPDGDSLSYAWSQTSGPIAILSDPGSVNPTFTPTQTGTYVFQLIVSDGSLAASDSVAVIVEDTLLVIHDLEVNVDGRSTDVDNYETISREAEPGSTVEFEIVVENLFDSTNGNLDIEDIEVDIAIKDIDDGDDLKQEEDEFDLDPGDDKTIRFSFDIPLIVEDGTFDVEISVRGEDESGRVHEVEWTVFLEVEKETHQIIIDDIHLTPSSVRCNQYSTLSVELINLGAEDEEDVVIEVESVELGLGITDEGIELEEGIDDDSRYEGSYRFKVEEDVDPGSYPITVRVYRDEDNQEAYETVNLAVLSCETTSTSQQQVSVGATPPIYPYEIPPYADMQEPKTEVSFTDSDWYLTLLAMGFVILLGGVIFMVGAVIILNKKKGRRF
ncbi:S8 family serine peptidase [Candidatus Woesearchaeota archaeon]|nr:S8 family serine peptidase [Candidatus Woesearchaeota archaeon]